MRFSDFSTKEQYILALSLREFSNSSLTFISDEGEKEELLERVNELFEEILLTD